MNVVLLADSIYIEEEAQALRHLVVGLVDERVRVVELAPSDAPMPDGLLGQRVGWSESRWSELNRWRLSRMDKALQSFEPSLIHCLTSRLWRGAVELSDELSVPAILGAATHAAIERVAKVLRKADPHRIAFAAGTEPLTQALRQRLDPTIVVETIPPGAHASEETHGCSEDRESLCAIVTGNGEYDEHYDALLQGIARVCKKHPQAQFFLEGQCSDQHELWRVARDLGLLPNLSLIPRRLGHRELLLSADVLLHPQPLGQARSITLEAMGHGLAVVAHEDPWLDYLIDGETAWVLPDPGAGEWQQRIEQLIVEPEAGQRLGHSARQWIRHGRLVSDQIARVLDLYRRMTGETIAFPA